MALVVVLHFDGITEVYTKQNIQCSNHRVHDNRIFVQPVDSGALYDQRIMVMPQD